MGDAHAKAQRLHRERVSHDVAQRLQHLRQAHVVARVDVLQVAQVVVPTRPAKTREVNVIVHPEVLERAERAVVDGVPKAQLSREAPLEVLIENRSVFPVGSLRGGSEAEQFLGVEVLQQALVRWGGAVVELVDDDHVETTRVDARKVECGEPLD